MIAHVGGVPIEEALGSLGPALLVALGAAWASLRAGLRRGARTPHGSAGSERARGDSSL